MAGKANGRFFLSHGAMRNGRSFARLFGWAMAQFVQSFAKESIKVSISLFSGMSFMLCP